MRPKVARVGPILCQLQRRAASKSTSKLTSSDFNTSPKAAKPDHKARTRQGAAKTTRAPSETASPVFKPAAAAPTEWWKPQPDPPGPDTDTFAEIPGLSGDDEADIASVLGYGTVIFSGIQPTGIPHLGNYLGALQNWKRMQDEAKPGVRLLYSIVDLHAITVPQQAPMLRQWKREMLAALLAVGIDPERSSIFYQSSVPAHSELMWILSCTASMGYLSRMTQWKSKLSLSGDTSALDKKAQAALKLGLFSYPVLQAADILVHRATHVPVGSDQCQHLEFARECATNFNHTFGGGDKLLTPPETILSPARRIMSLQTPTSKMSKSDTDPRSRILLTDSRDEIRKKIMFALTDSTNSVSYDRDSRPGVSNLLELWSYFDTQSRTPQTLAAELAAQNANLRDLKVRVANILAEAIPPIGDRFRTFMDRDEGAYLTQVEEEGAMAARRSADDTMRIVRDAVGLSSPGTEMHFAELVEESDDGTAEWDSFGRPIGRHKEEEDD